MLRASHDRRTENPDAGDTGEARRSSCAHRITVGVVENDRLVREGLAALLNTVEDFDCVGAWNQAEEALTAIEALRPDVLLLDTRQLQPAGPTPFERLPCLSPSTRVLLTMNGPEEWWGALNIRSAPSRRGGLALLPALQFGVCGIVCKERGFRWISEGIRTAYAGEHGLEPGSAVGSIETCPRSLPLETSPEAEYGERLTVREWQVILLIGQGCSNKEIARQMQLGYSTVKNYVSSVLKKLQIEGRTQIALLAHQWTGELGLSHREQPSSLTTKA